MIRTTLRTVVRTSVALAVAGIALVVFAQDVQPAPTLVLAPGQVSSTSVTDPSTTTRATRDLPRTNLEAEERDGNGSPAPWLIGSGVLALVSIAIGGTILKRRSS